MIDFFQSENKFYQDKYLLTAFVEHQYLALDIVPSERCFSRWLFFFKLIAIKLVSGN